MNDTLSPTEKATRLKRKFIEDTLLKEAVRDATAHGFRQKSRPVFDTYASGKAKRDAFRADLKEELRSLTTQYQGNDVVPEMHIQNISRMSERLEKNHAETLKDGKLYF